MAIIDLPAAARIRRVEWTYDVPAQVNRSGWTRRRQVVLQPGPPMWSATAELVVKIGEADMLAVEAFLVDLKGPVNSFRLRASENPQARFALPLTVTGANQTGAALNVAGGQPGAFLRRGHKITVADQLLMVMANTTFAADGTATLPLDADLRSSPANGAAVEAIWPTALMSITGTSVGWSVDPGQLYQAKALALEEAI